MIFLFDTIAVALLSAKLQNVSVCILFLRNSALESSMCSPMSFLISFALGKFFDKYLMAYLHYGLCWATAGHNYCIDGIWLIGVDSGRNGDGEGWFWEWFVSKHQRRSAYVTEVCKRWSINGHQYWPSSGPLCDVNQIKRADGGHHATTDMAYRQP